MSPTSSRNTVPWSAASKMPRFSWTAPVNAPLSWPNSSLSSSVSVSAEQLILTNGPRFAQAVLLDRGGDQLLAGAALAGDQHRGVRSADRVHQPEHLLHPRAAADHAEELVALRGGTFKLVVFAHVTQHADHPGVGGGGVADQEDAVQHVDGPVTGAEDPLSVVDDVLPVLQGPADRAVGFAGGGAKHAAAVEAQHVRPAPAEHLKALVVHRRDPPFIVHSEHTVGDTGEDSLLGLLLPLHLPVRLLGGLDELAEDGHVLVDFNRPHGLALFVIEQAAADAERSHLAPAAVDIVRRQPVIALGLQAGAEQAGSFLADLAIHHAAARPAQRILGVMP